MSRGRALILALPLLATITARPSHAEPVAPPPYSGAFRAVEIAAGPVVFDGEMGAGLMAGVRASTVLHLADLDLGYDLAHLPDAGASVHRLALSAHLHPLSFFLLSSDPTGAALASIYVRLGAGPALLSADSTDLAFSWHWGAGFDLPLADPDDGSGFWLGLLYNRSHVLDTDGLGDSVVQHLLLRLGYRRNGL